MGQETTNQVSSHGNLETEFHILMKMENEVFHNTPTTLYLLYTYSPFSQNPKK